MTIDELIDRINDDLDTKNQWRFGPVSSYFSASRFVTPDAHSDDLLAADEILQDTEDGGLVGLDVGDDVTRRDLSVLLFEEADDLTWNTGGVSTTHALPD